MKACQLVPLAFASALSAQCAVFELKLSDSQVKTLVNQPNVIALEGITGGNAVPNASIALNTGDQTLFLNFAWGDLNGLKDLNTAFTAASLQLTPSGSPQPQVLYDLTPHVLQQTPTDGGVFGYTLHLGNIGNYSVVQQEIDLLQARWYLAVQTVGSPTGEIRTQLAPVPESTTYGLVAGLGLLGFAIYRKRRAPATA